MSNERKEIELVGELGETDELCDDGSSALSLMTAEGDEYIICNRKIVRRLMKYAEAQVEITLRGYVRHDPSGIEILSVTGYDAPQLDDDSDYNYGDSEPAPRARKHRRKIEELDEDEDGSLDNDDSHDDEDFDADDSMDFDGMDDEQEPTPEELAELDAALANDDLNISFEEEASASKPQKSSRKRQKK